MTPTNEEVSKALEEWVAPGSQPFGLDVLVGKFVSGVELVKEGLPRDAPSFLKISYSDGTYLAISGFGEMAGGQYEGDDEWVERGGIYAAYFDGTRLRTAQIDTPPIKKKKFG